MGPVESLRSLLDQRRPSPAVRQVGSRIARFEACSAFTHVMACELADSPKEPFPGVLQSKSLAPQPPKCYWWIDQFTGRVSEPHEYLIENLARLPHGESIDLIGSRPIGDFLFVLAPTSSCGPSSSGLPGRRRYRASPRSTPAGRSEGAVRKRARNVAWKASSFFPTYTTGRHLLSTGRYGKSRRHRK